MAIVHHHLVDPNVTASTGRQPLEIAGVAEQLRQVPNQVDGAALSATSHHTHTAEQSVQSIEPQSWLFEQRTRYRSQGHCDPYAEQMLRRMGLLTEHPAR